MWMDVSHGPSTQQLSAAVCFGGADPAPQKGAGWHWQRAGLSELLASTALSHHPFGLWPVVELLLLSTEQAEVIFHVLIRAGRAHRYLPKPLTSNWS